MSRAIFVSGATGKQGGALIDSLLQENADFEILALTRDASSASAQKLAKKSPKIKLIQGDLANIDAVFDAAKKATTLPIWGVYSVAIGNKQADSELVQGKALVDAAIKAGAKFFVYSSIDRHGEASLENPTDVPHFIHKHKIEKHLIEQTKNGEMDWTILRPVAFMENFADSLLGRVFVTSWKMVIKEKPLQLIAVPDIGIVAAKVFLHPEEYKNRAISLAGDEITIERANEIFNKYSGRNFTETWRILCSLIMWGIKDFGYMLRWFHDVGYAADIEEVKRIHPDVKDFETWLLQDSEFASRLRK
ncbi:unnamed protein product [Parascedosporium putredinis]|uniref:NmrA-like domain-containing protein n=1 Tax=Parascedosporium putredinis TaxID=1442378 RepID=A0A9P1HAI7_9PEZI|nr:unnamed protein product [Parascedosporium putredinis]CAI8002751.1 unnamed protein product [Parascedosporium putredinis]